MDIWQTCYPENDHQFYGLHILFTSLYSLHFLWIVHNAYTIRKERREGREGEGRTGEVGRGGI